MSESDANRQFEVSLGPARQAYLVCIEGSMTVTSGGTIAKMLHRDSAEIVGSDDSSSPVSLSTGINGAHFMIIEMKKE